MQFGAAMAIMNLLLRPLSCYLLFRIVQDRAEPEGSQGLPSGFDSLFGESGFASFREGFLRDRFFDVVGCWWCGSLLNLFCLS